MALKTNAKIYVMQAEDGTLKLGHSVNPLVRSKRLGVVASVVHETDVVVHAEKIERLAHRVLALHGKHLRGEWFEATVEDAIKAIEIATKQAENEELSLGGNLKVKGRKGRPHGSVHDAMVHFRLPNTLRQRLEAVSSKRGDQPSITAMLREAAARFADQEEEKLRR